MEQQIAERAKQYALSMYPDLREEELQSFSDCRRDYAHGARDQHKIDIDKAWNWILDNYSGAWNNDIFQDDFRKAME